MAHAEGALFARMTNKGTLLSRSVAFIFRIILVFFWSRMAFSTKIKGNHHLQGNVQVSNVRIPVSGCKKACPLAPTPGLPPPHKKSGGCRSGAREAGAAGDSGPDGHFGFSSCLKISILSQVFSNFERGVRLRSFFFFWLTIPFRSICGVESVSWLPLGVLPRENALGSRLAWRQREPIFFLGGAGEGVAAAAEAAAGETHFLCGAVDVGRFPVLE